MNRIYAALIAGLCWLASAPLAHAQHNGVDYCAHGTRSTLVLFDRTTPVDADDIQNIRASLGGVVDHLSSGERLVLATIERHYSLSDEIFNACMPGCPPNNGPLGACSALRAQQEAGRFRARLFRALQPMLHAAPEQQHSDITGTLTRQAGRAPRPYTRVILYSDMLENSEALPWRTFRDADNTTLMATVQRYRLTPRLRGASVSIVGFGRLHDHPRDALSADVDAKIREFWSAYFRAAGAREPSFE